MAKISIEHEGLKYEYYGNWWECIKMFFSTKNTTDIAKLISEGKVKLIS